MRRVLLPTIAWDAGAVSERPLIFALSVTVVIALAVGFAAIPQVLGTAVTPALHGTRRSQGARDSRTRRALLIAQMAMSVTLLIGAGLFVRSLINVDRLDLGVEADRVLVAAVGWPRPAAPASTLADRARENNTWRQLRERIAHYPGVEHAALAIGSPFGSGFGVDVRVPGRDSLPAAPGGGPYISAVGPDYFRTTGTQIVGGRPFAPEDGPESARVAIVNQTMASLVWPNEDAIGKCIIVNDTGCAIVVGIARDARRNAIQEPASMQYYVPFGQETEIGGTVLLVRPVADARAFTQTLRGAILAEARGANFIKVTSMHDRIDPQVRPWRMGATMFTLFGALALVVAAVGLYGVIAYSTAQRTHEFGVRLAIGASSARMTRTVLAEALWIASVGVVVGGFAALIVAGRIAPLLFNVSPRDPFVFAIVALMLVCVALLASLVPALRAARVDPVIALRST
jgi:predicted permease